MKRLFLYLCMTIVATWAYAQGMPENGNTYYIYCDNDQTQYFYNNDGVLSVSNTCNEGDPSYQWNVTGSGNTFVIQSNSDPSCYFGFKEMVSEPYSWTISSNKAYADGNVTLNGDYGTRKGIYMVMKNDGKFDQASGTYNKATTDYSSDYCFVNINKPETRPVSITYLITGSDPYPVNNYRVSYLNVKYGNITKHKSITVHDNGLTESVDVPVGTDVEVTENVRYHGYELKSVVKTDDDNVTVTIESDADNLYQYLWYSNSPDGHPYRIPAIATTNKGTLLAITDYRPANNDIGYGEVDLMLRRSEDNGQTWTPSECIADGNPATAKEYPYFGCGYGDAALVADRESDEVLVICVSGKVVYASANSNYRPCIARLRSHDGGQTWSKPENITAQFYGEEGALFTQKDKDIDCYAAFFGSGKILQSKVVKKSNYYRLYAAMLCRGNNVKGAYVVYSDDFGQTWELLSANDVQAANGSDEPKVEELPNGDIVLSGRKSSGRYFNVWNWKDGARTQGAWGTVVASNNVEGGISVGGNSCNGEILMVDAVKLSTGKRETVVLQSLPWGNNRSNVGIWFKEIKSTTKYSPTTFAKNWTKGLQVSTRGSAYSTMSVQTDGRIAFFFEEEPNSFCMVYVPLTLEQITNGLYRMYDPTTDGIGEMKNEEGETFKSNGESIFDLSGRRIGKPVKGLYLKGGKKLIVPSI